MDEKKKLIIKMGSAPKAPAAPEPPVVNGTAACEPAQKLTDDSVKKAVPPYSAPVVEHPAGKPETAPAKTNDPDAAWRRPRSFTIGEVVDTKPPVRRTATDFDARTPEPPVKSEPVRKGPTSSRLIWSNRQNKQVISSAYFIAVNGNGSVKTFPVLNGQSIGSIWGTSSIPDIALSAAGGSFQARIELEDGRLWYRNENAGVSTYHNGVQAMERRFELQYGDVIRIHSFTDSSWKNDTVLVLLDHYWDLSLWETFPIRPDKPVRFDHAGKPGESLSFTRQRGGVLFGGAGISGSLRINGRPSETNKQLAPMDVVQCGDDLFVYVGDSVLLPPGWKPAATVGEPPVSVPGPTPGPVPGPTPRPASRPAPAAKGSLDIHIKDRTVSEGLNGRKTLLKDIRLSIPKGSLVLILGGSGAGKTTFVNAVMGYEPANGQIRYNGIDVYREYDRMKYEIGYVQQEDLLRRTDVVIHTLKDAARMHLRAGKREQQTAVLETLKLLGLENEKNKLVGQLSGGQRKRLSIGVEYVGQPSLFFLDEPDSGLDGSNADNMWEIARKIADTGKIVMVISHIPDRAFDRFDTVIVLAKDKTDCGRLAYMGTPEDACAFFGTERLEEIVRRVNRTSEGGEGRADEFIAKFESSRRLA